MSCLWVLMPNTRDGWDIDPLSIGLAVFIGLLVGGLIALGCWKLCIKDIMRYKKMDPECGYMASNRYASHQREHLIVQTKSMKKRNRAMQQQKQKRLQSAKKKKGDQGPLVIITTLTLEPAKTEEPKVNGKEGKKGAGVDGEESGMVRGLGDALLLDNPGAVEAEIARQDTEAVNNLEKELREENLNTMVQLLRTMLNQQLSKGKVNANQYKDIMKQYQDGMDNAIRTTQREQEEEEEEFRKKHKDPVVLQKELDKLHPKYVQKLNGLVQDEKENIRKKLAGQTQLTESELDALMANLAENMANHESKLGAERARQAANLEERLAQRQQLVEFNRAEKKIMEKDSEARLEIKSALLKEMVDDGKLSDRQRQEILDEYSADEEKVKTRHMEEMQKQKLALAEKLRKRREGRMEEVEKEQEKEREEFLNQTDQSTDPAAVVDGYHQLMQNQRQDREALLDEMDQAEAEELKHLIKGHQKDIEHELTEQEDNFKERLASKPDISKKDIDQLMNRYEAELEDYEELKSAEKKRMRGRMEEKLEKRRLKAEAEAKKDIAEQCALKEQQDATLEKVLKSQVELTQEMEQKLQARKSKVAELKEKVEETNKSKKEMKEKEKEAIMKQIEEEEKRLEADKKQQLQDLRERVSSETAAALGEQERQLGLLIARLQVGQARRLAIIEKQDKTIKELEDQLVNHVAKDAGGDQGLDEVDGGPSDVVDAILVQHQNQVEQLQDRMEEVKERQEQMLQEKLQAKQIKKKRDIENKLEKEAEVDWKKQRSRGAGQRELLNQELEEELHRELDERKKNFLAQVAVIGKVSKDEMAELVDNAVIGGSMEE
ncbi:hypothetical protein CAPTEDRAFT_186106 [Capitella teleta]|uniref:CARD domain-containing protein n=1 Tax=Capitella teleta TaxID=283909 RepID=R7TPE2_CAPTE|nr:hypothetical protein CAPTEDRAFT_186106 [Capitella teleta]|eukprot:ELT95534.1 hypothetical protein CAPTEDRAFT_186106 [Capitella teleta]